MATVLLIHDDDAERRARTARAAAARMAEFDGIETETRSHGSITLVWAARPGIPLDFASQGSRHAFVMGDAIMDAEGRRATASDHLRATPTLDAAPVYDGLHVAIAFDEAGTFQIGVDTMGLFPLYYASAGGARLAATSPALLRTHPGFRAALDPFGLAAVLATNSLIQGHTVYAGVTRLEQGHALTAPPDSAFREHAHYEVPVTRDLHEAPREVCANELHEALRAACCRHVPEGVPHTHMLSGGLDSRLLAGELVRENRSITALTRGQPNDIEYRCARGVARHLGIEHHLVAHNEYDATALPAAVQWEGLTGSPGTGSSGSGAATLRRFHPHAVTGYMCDAIVGGSHVNWVEKEGTPPVGFDWAWWRVANWGLPLDVLRRLLRRDVFGDAADDVHETYRKIYETAGETHHERNYRLGIRYRNRFGNGDVLGRLTFGAWPRSPHLDREVVRVSAAIAPGVIGGRELEKRILEKFHLGLACLPLDRNSYDWRPIQPRVSHWIEHALAKRVRAVKSSLGLLKENRYYFRTYDINGEHWRAIRRLLEPSRELAYTVFEREVYDELIPPPDEAIRTRVGIADVAGRKSLLASLVMLPHLTDS